MKKNRNRSLIWCMAISVLFLGVTISCNEKESESYQVTPVHPKIEKLNLKKGFQAEHLYSPAENDQGSWVAMTFDDKDRLITSDQFGALYRLELPTIGSNSSKPHVEKLIIGNAAQADSIKSHGGMGYAQGVLWAFNSLYVMVNNDTGNEDFDRGSGLYRLQDSNGDDQFDKVTLLKSLNGSGEHGPHSIVMGPDKKSLYVVAGNHTDVPEMDAYRLPPVWQYDNLFPQIKDPRGHANDREAPGGWIAKVDSLGQHWELISAGYRNPYDLAFNDEGDLFAYDSDMEWDFGLPWYRPTRIVHVTSGSEFGWRTGNGKWSPAYPDNLPPVLNIGQGSPTNLVYGGNANFPEKYRKAMFGFDWSFGIIYAIFPVPEGASYRAEAEEFLSGSPLPLTDGVIGPDGALYFLTGGRKLESDLYRVYYTNNEEEGINSFASDSKTSSSERTEEAKIRMQLEQFHTGEAKEGAIKFAWKHLNHNDRFVRYAARIAVEHQPLIQWKDRALNEVNPSTLAQAIIALARHGDENLTDEMLEALMRVNLMDLEASVKQDLLRAFELVLYRNENPTLNLREQVIAHLNPHFPAENNNLNRSLVKLLVKLDAPQVVPKTIALLDKGEDEISSDQEMFTKSADLILRNPQYGLDIAAMLAEAPPAQNVYYVTALSEVSAGWTPELYEKYFKWIRGSFNYKGGRSYIGFIDEARKKALSRVPKDVYEHFNIVSGDSLVGGGGNDLVDVPGPEGPGRPWTVDDAFAVIEEDGLTKRNLERGKQLYAATLCISCHTMNGEGGLVGPDLSQLGNRFSVRDILQATIHPNEVVSDQYAATVFELQNGNSIVGRLIKEDDARYFVSQNPFTPKELREIPKDQVLRTKDSDISVMLPGLINSLNPEELKNLMAYLISGGNKNHEVYREAEAD